MAQMYSLFHCPVQVLPCVSKSLPVLSAWTAAEESHPCLPGRLPGYDACHENPHESGTLHYEIRRHYQSTSKVGYIVLHNQERYNYRPRSQQG